MINLLFVLLNIFWSSEMIPDTLRIGNIIPLFKSGDRRNPLNYRPITLLNVLGKLYCSIIDNRLREYMEGESRLADEQAGFRKN